MANAANNESYAASLLLPLRELTTNQERGESMTMKRRNARPVPAVTYGHSIAATRLFR